MTFVSNSSLARRGGMLAIAVLQLAIACCSNDVPGSPTATSLAEIVSMKVSQRASNGDPQRVESILTLSLHESPLRPSEWIAEHVSVYFRLTLNSIPIYDTPTGFEFESRFHTSGSRLDDRPLVPGMSREFSEEVPRRDPGETFETRWELRFVNHGSGEHLILSTEWVPIR